MKARAGERPFPTDFFFVFSIEKYGLGRHVYELEIGGHEAWNQKEDQFEPELFAFFFFRFVFFQ